MTSNQVRVVVRCKPSAEEKTWKVDGNSLQCEEEKGPALEFDNVFGEATSHADLYNQAIAPSVATALQGNNVSVLTYGLPSTGKSYSVFGTSGQTRIKQEARGVITRCGQQIFDSLQRDGSVSRMSASFCHVFEDGRVADLFDTKKRSLEIMEGTTMVFSVPSLTEQVVTSAQELLRLVEKGYLMRNATGCVRETTGRKQAPTMQPLQQYRQHCSHAIFTLTIEHIPSVSGRTTVSRIMVVDISGKSIEEFHSNGQTSDSGVEMLHKVMMTLPSDGITAASALFPQSSLTKLLKPCLGGNSQSVLIANVCLGKSSTANTRKCLELLQKTRLIRNYSKPTTLSLPQSTLGKLLDESGNLKAAIAQKLQISSPVATWEAVRDTAVKINGTLYEQLSPSCQDLVKKVAAVEAQLLRSGKPPLKADGGQVRPLTMLRPTVKAPPSLQKPIVVDKAPMKPLASSTSLKPPTLLSSSQKISTTQGSSESISSLEEESESDSDAEPPDTPVIHGPPPPPLRGIPHINPDATPAMPTPTLPLSPSPALPAPATRQINSSANTATSPVSHVPKQQPETSSHLSQQQIPKPMPQTASPQISVPPPTRSTPPITVVLPQAHTPITVPQTASPQTSVPPPTRSTPPITVPQTASPQTSVPAPTRSTPPITVPQTASPQTSVPPPTRSTPPITVPQTASPQTSVPAPTRSTPPITVPQTASPQTSVPPPTRSTPPITVPQTASPQTSVPPPTRSTPPITVPQTASPQTSVPTPTRSTPPITVPQTASPQISIPAPTRLTPPITVVLPQTHTSTPKARRTLLPELASQSHTEEVHPQPPIKEQDRMREQPPPAVDDTQPVVPTPIPAVDNTQLRQPVVPTPIPAVDDTQLRQPVVPTPIPAVDDTQLRQPVVPTPIPARPNSSLTPFPRVSLSPIRPVGVAPSLLSRPMLPPVQGHGTRQHAISTSTMASSTDSLSNSSSDEDLSDEARDNFDPNMQQRRLAMQSVRPYIVPHNSLTTVTRHAVLPPIAHGTTTPPHLTQGSTGPTNNPPSYEQSSLNESRHSSMGEGGPPDYYQGTGQTRSEGGGDGEYISSEEIHVAAMEGVKASTLRKLAVRFGVDYRDHGGRTPLMYAILGNQPRMCEVLLSLGAVVNIRDGSGLTPLLWATYQAKPLVMKTLLKHGADSLVCDLEGRNVYHWAVKTPNIQCLKVLCKQANTGIVNKPDNEGLTPLHWAVMGDQASHIRILLTSTNADASKQDKEGRTPLNYAILSFSPSCIKAILDCCESVVNVKDPKGRTALHYACAEGSADCVRTLLSYRSCDLHCTDTRGTTPLHWAAAANQPGLVQLLLRRGADRAQKDNDDVTALGHAQQRGHTECVRILQTYGLRRPMSAISIASQVSLLPTTPPAVDEFGHVPLRRPNRRFSLSVGSIDRMPADGQAHSDEQSPTEEGVSECPEHTSHTSLARWAEPRSSQQPQRSEVRRRRWLPLLCCSGKVVPVESTHSDTSL